MNASDIKNNSDKQSVNKSNNELLNAKFYKVEGNTILYTVSSSNRNKQYLVKIQLLDLSSNKLNSLESALAGNVKISCTCPGFLYQGYKYISYKKQVGIDKETRAPNITNPSQEGLACKHILVVLDKLKSDYSLIRNALKLNQSDTKQTPADIKNNKNSDNITEYDLKIIDDFNNECLKLYDEYMKYLSNKDADEFINSKLYSGTNPTSLLNNLSKQASKMIKPMFIGRLNSLENLLNYISNKRNSFLILLKSDIHSLTKKINSSLKATTEAIVNNIILNMFSEYYI